MLLLPLITGVLSLIFFFGQLSFLRLHLHSVTDVAVRQAAIYGCSGVDQIIKRSISNHTGIQDIRCSIAGKDVEVKLHYSYQSRLPFFDSIQKDFEITSFAINEQQEG